MPIVPTTALTMITARDVPFAITVGMPSPTIIIGTRTEPPPTPSSPETTPAKHSSNDQQKPDDECHLTMSPAVAAPHSDSDGGDNEQDSEKGSCQSSLHLTQQLCAEPCSHGRPQRKQSGHGPRDLSSNRVS
ncbi:MAG: hypothetical protein V9F03_10030 [Microthrixaceae bacterium]